jgi:hypothetical protein
VQILRFAPQARFWGEVQSDFVGKTAPAGWPKIRLSAKEAKEMRHKHGWKFAAVGQHCEHRNGDIDAIGETAPVFSRSGARRD